MKNNIAKTIGKYTLIGIIILAATLKVTKFLGVTYKVPGIQITDFHHCGETSGFPFKYFGRGESTRVCPEDGSSCIIGDCFSTFDNTSFMLNIVFWAIIFIIIVCIYKKWRKSSISKK